MSTSSRQPRIRMVDAVLIGLLGLILTIVLLAIVCRYVFNQSLVWSDEIVRYLFAWFTIIGSAVVLRDRCHIRVEFFVDLLPEKFRRRVELAGLVLVVVFNATLAVIGLMWVMKTRGTFTPALGMPLNWVLYGALPTAAILTCWYGIRRLRVGQYAELKGDVDKGVIS